MRQIMLRTLAVGASALGLFAFGGAAVATPSFFAADGLGHAGSLQAGSLIVPVMDEETLAVEKDLRPDEVPEDMKDEGAPKAPMSEPSEEKSAGDIEDETIDKIGPGAE